MQNIIGELINKLVIFDISLLYRVFVTLEISSIIFLSSSGISEVPCICTPSCFVPL